MKERILIVEDEPALEETLAYNLKRQGYEVEVSEDGREAIQLAHRFLPDLILLDIMLPGMDGFEVCRVLRQDLNMPIIFLTARDDEIDRIIGLEIGGDDYISKPFNMRELLARVKARLRLTQKIREEVTADIQANGLPEPAGVRTFGNLSINEIRREILLDGQVMPVKPREYDLMLYFARHQGRVVSREMILQQVWDHDFLGDSRTVDVHVRWLREKIEPDPAHPIRITTVRGGGYRFEG